MHQGGVEGKEEEEGNGHGQGKVDEGESGSYQTIYDSRSDGERCPVTAQQQVERRELCMQVQVKRQEYGRVGKKMGGTLL